MKIVKKYTKRLRKKLDKKETNIKNIDVLTLKSIKEKAKEITDMRIKKKCTYKLWDIICVVFLASICNCNDWGDIEIFARKNKEWLRSFLQLTGRIPPAVTYKNIMSIVDAQELHNFCAHAYSELIESARKKGDIYHFDGKVENSSKRKTNKNNEKVKPLNILNVYSEGTSLCIGQERIEDKTNEITAIPDLIKKLNIKGVVCTWDALNTQTDTVDAVIEGHGDYVGALKGNHELFYKEVVEYFDEDRLLIIEAGYEGAYKLVREKSHSQIITYQYYQTEKVNWYEDKEKWNKLRSLVLVVKTTEDKEGKKTVEKRYYISSLLLNIELFSKAIRNHWSVENKLHWHLDFTFKCDDNRTVDKRALLNLQIIKKNALNLLKTVQNDYKLSIQKIRFMASLDPETEIPKIFYLAKKKGWNFDMIKA